MGEKNEMAFELTDNELAGVAGGTGTNYEEACTYCGYSYKRAQDEHDAVYEGLGSLPEGM